MYKPGQLVYIALPCLWGPAIVPARVVAPWSARNSERYWLDVGTGPLHVLVFEWEIIAGRDQTNGND